MLEKIGEHELIEYLDEVRLFEQQMRIISSDILLCVCVCVCVCGVCVWVGVCVCVWCVYGWVGGCVCVCMWWVGCVCTFRYYYRQLHSSF